MVPGQSEAQRTFSSRLEHILQINVAVLVALGTLLLSLAQRNMQLPAVAVIAVIAGVLFTDILGWIRLNRIVANLAAVVALALSLPEFLTFDSTRQLLAVATLLIYLQIVLLFQAKTIRMYWQMLILSVLQIVVAAALNTGSSFGILLVVYMLLAISALGVFFIFRELVRFDELALAGGSRPALAAAVAVPQRSFWNFRSTVAPARVQAGHMTGPNSLELERRGLGWRWVIRTLIIGSGTLLIAGIVFTLMPRGGERWGRAGSMARSVGFTERVKLGALGAVSQNPQQVLEISFRRNSSQEPIQLSEPPLLRGTVLTSYDRGVWENRDRLIHGPVARLEQPPADSNYIRQQVRIEPLDTNVLFGVYPVYRVAGSNVEWDNEDGGLARPDSLKRQRQTYELATTGIHFSTQHAITPGSKGDDYRPMSAYRFYRSMQSDNNWKGFLSRATSAQSWVLLQLPDPVDGVDPLATLKATAKQLLDESTLESDDVIGRARMLERYLSSNKFQYTLSPQRRDSDLDPIEDFIKNNPRGHCEYFATALVLMLRSQGIPARMVVGFRGGDWNSLGNFYQVRQLHAHTWVEVFLPTVDPTDPAYQGESHEYGYWLRLDPTPGGESAAATNLGIMDAIADVADYIESLWKTYVVGLSEDKQKTSIYQPLTARLQQLFKDFAMLPVWDAWHRWWSPVSLWIAANWRSWRVISAGVLALVLAVIVVRASYRLLRRAWLYFRKGRSADESRIYPEVSFYKQLEEVLEKHGLVRPEAQTHRQFLVSIPSVLGPTSINGHLEESLDQVADAFYRVRFGGRQLDDREEQAVQQAVEKIELALSDRSSNGQYAYASAHVPA